MTVFLLQACSSRSDEIHMDNLGATVSYVLKNAIDCGQTFALVLD